MFGSVKTYFQQIAQVMKSISIGMFITMRYFLTSYGRRSEVITLQYPHEIDDIPERWRGIHFLETEICIMCYQCARACPVDCIEIEGTRAVGLDGTIEGAKGAWMSKFTIDYNRCIFCNLCIEPCPTDCIHMGKEYDWSGYSRADMVKNLLTDEVFTVEDALSLKKARVSIKEAEAEIARKKAEAKAAKVAKGKAEPKGNEDE